MAMPFLVDTVAKGVITALVVTIAISRPSWPRNGTLRPPLSVGKSRFTQSASSRINTVISSIYVRESVLVMG